MRLFAAVEPDQDTRRALAAVQAGLCDALRASGHADAERVRPVRHAGLHMTLRFFGATPPERIPELATAMQALAAGAQPCSVAMQRSEYWPPRAPRVIVAVFDTPAALQALAAGMEALARAFGYATERRRFRAHVTLARAPGVSLPRAPVPVPTCAMPVDHMVLMRSDTLPEGAVYTPLHRVPLGAPDR